METFAALLAICAGNSPATGEFPEQRPVTRQMFPFDDVIMWSGLDNIAGNLLTEQTIEQTIETLVILDAIAFIMTSH